MKPESRPSSEQGLAGAVNLAGTFDHEFTQTPMAKHASFSGSLVAEVPKCPRFASQAFVLQRWTFHNRTERQRAASSHQRGSRNPRPPGTKSREKHTAKPVQSGKHEALLKSFGQCLRLVYCL